MATKAKAVKCWEFMHEPGFAIGHLLAPDGQCRFCVPNMTMSKRRLFRRIAMALSAYKVTPLARPAKRGKKQAKNRSRK